MAAFALATLLGIQPALAQSPPPAPQVVVLDDQVEVEPSGRVTARILVDDANGAPDVDVAQSELNAQFGGQPVNGVHVTPFLTAPVQAVLGLDVSLSRPNDRAHTSILTTTVIAAGGMISSAFGSSLIAFPFSMTVPLTPTANDLSWLANPNLWRGNRTDLYGAVERAATALSAMPPAPGRKAIVIITNSGNTVAFPQAFDGAQFLNRAARAIAAAKQAQAPVFVLTVEERDRPIGGRQAELEAFVRQTGGSAKNIPLAQASTLGNELRELMAALQTGYVVSFTVPATTQVRLDLPQQLEIGVAPTRPVVATAPALTPLTTTLHGASTAVSFTAVSLSDEISLTVDPTWLDGISEVQLFANGEPVTTTTASAFPITLHVLREKLRDWDPNKPLIVTATVQHNWAAETSTPPLTITLPSKPNQTWMLTKANSDITYTNSITMYDNDAMRLAVIPPVSETVTYSVTDAQGRLVTETTTPLTLPLSLPPGVYTITAQVADALGRRVDQTFSLSIVPHVSPLLGMVLAVILLLLLLLAVLYSAWQAAQKRRRDEAHAEKVYRLVNRGNQAVEYVVMADYSTSDLQLQLGLMGDSPREAEIDDSGRLTLVTPAIKPQDSVQVRVAIDPVKPGARPEYEFLLLAHAASQDAAASKWISFTIKSPSQKRRQS